MEAREKSRHTDARKRDKKHSRRGKDEKKENNDGDRSRKQLRSERPRKAGQSISPQPPPPVMEPPPRPETPPPKPQEGEIEQQLDVPVSTSSFPPNYPTPPSSTTSPLVTSNTTNYSQLTNTTVASSVIGDLGGVPRIPDKLTIRAHGRSTSTTVELPATVDTATEITLISDRLARRLVKRLKLSVKAASTRRSYLEFGIEERIKANLEISGKFLENEYLYLVPDRLIGQQVVLGTEVWQKIQPVVLPHESERPSTQYSSQPSLPSRSISGQIDSNDYYSYQSSLGSQFVFRPAPAYPSSAGYHTAHSHQSLLAGSQSGAATLTDSVYGAEDVTSTPRTVSADILDSAQHNISSNSEETYVPRSTDNNESSNSADPSTYTATYTSAQPPKYSSSYPSSEQSYPENAQYSAYAPQPPDEASPNYRPANPAPWEYHKF